MHPRLVTYLKGFQSYFSRGGLIPLLTNTVLQYKLFVDGETAAHLEKLDRIECGHVPPHSRVHFYSGITGMHNSLGPSCTLKNVQYWVRQDGATSKAASPAAPPTRLGTSVQGLTQRFEQLSMRNASSSAWVGHIPENGSAESSPIALDHDTISAEPYTGHSFPALEMTSAANRHHGTKLTMQAIGTNFNWTLNQEIVFSAALTGKPVRKQEFQQYCWKRCVIGTSRDYAMALFKDEWYDALRCGDLSRSQVAHGEPLIFCP